MIIHSHHRCLALQTPSNTVAEVTHNSYPFHVNSLCLEGLQPLFLYFYEMKQPRATHAVALILYICKKTVFPRLYENSMFLASVILITEIVSDIVLPLLNTTGQVCPEDSSQWS